MFFCLYSILSWLYAETLFVYSMATGTSKYLFSIAKNSCIEKIFFPDKFSQNLGINSWWIQLAYIGLCAQHLASHCKEGSLRLSYRNAVCKISFDLSLFLRSGWR